MRFRQVHLDFHTSEAIAGIGSAFDAKQFQDMLRKGHVDSITIFSKCHHGWTYHPTTAGRQHPGLKFDLLKAQLDACHAIDVKAPVYISAGLDEQSYWRHPEWSRRLVNGEVPWAHTNDRAGYHEMCLNTGYLDQLLAQIEEVCAKYDADGIFLDIVSPRDCWCNTCVVERMKKGDPRDAALIKQQNRDVYLNYTRKVRAAIDKHKPGLNVFHNGGHIQRGDREIAQQNTHLELESLPTGGWGYDHFPLSAGYARVVGMPFLGMTGKFHESWGEFGGYKHPNALRYESCAAIAQGARVSVGDQLHPDGRMEPATYAIIGAGFAEVERKEAWCVGTRSLAEVALLSQEACGGNSAAGQMAHGNAVDEGAVRILCEGKVWFDVVDMQADWTPYRLLILPDGMRLAGELEKKVKAYIAQGGRVLATGDGGMAADRDEQLLDLGAKAGPAGTLDPSYINPRFATAWEPTAFVVYGPVRSNTATGEVLADREDAYFNRDITHFCSHRHTPNRRGAAGPAITVGKQGTWLAFPACQIYQEHGQQIVRDLVLHAIQRELGGQQVETSLPAAGRLTLQRQDEHKRDVLHLLFATPSKRGKGVEVIEDLIPLADVRVSVRRGKKPSAVTLVPEGTSVPFTYEQGRVVFTVSRVECHQMVVLAD